MLEPTCDVLLCYHVPRQVVHSSTQLVRRRDSIASEYISICKQTDSETRCSKTTSYNPQVFYTNNEIGSKSSYVGVAIPLVTSCSRFPSGQFKVGPYLKMTSFSNVLIQLFPKFTFEMRAPLKTTMN